MTGRSRHHHPALLRDVSDYLIWRRGVQAATGGDRDPADMPASFPVLATAVYERSGDWDSTLHFVYVYPDEAQALLAARRA